MAMTSLELLMEGSCDAKVFSQDPSCNKDGSCQSEDMSQVSNESLVNIAFNDNQELKASTYDIPSYVDEILTEQRVLSHDNNSFSFIGSKTKIIQNAIEKQAKVLITWDSKLQFDVYVNYGFW